MDQEKPVHLFWVLPDWLLPEMHEFQGLSSNVWQFHHFKLVTVVRFGVKLMMKVDNFLSFFQDVFTVSVGNLPPGAEVAIKITYVCELPVKVNEDDMTDYIEFHLPGCLASSVKNQVLIAGPVTQTTVDRVSADSTQLR